MSDLEKAGFVLNFPKSHLEPHQIAEWLGFITDLCAGCFKVPPDKINRLKMAIHSIISHGNRVAARLLASMNGRIISMSLAIGPVCRLLTGALYVVLNRRTFWTDWLSLTKDALEELHFWRQNIDCFNGQSIWFSAGTT